MENAHIMSGEKIILFIRFYKKQKEKQKIGREYI